MIMKTIIDWAAALFFLLGIAWIIYSRLRYKPPKQCPAMFQVSQKVWLTCQLEARHAGLHTAATGAQWPTVTHAAYTDKLPFDNSNMASIARLRKG